MDSGYVTDKAISLIRQLHGITIGAKEFSGGFMPERADAFLFNSVASFLIETKISRADFKADFKKEFRKEGGIGRYRYYACPEGLIKPEELPEKWGLIYVRPNNKRALMPVGFGGTIKVGEEKCERGWTQGVFESFGSEYTGDKSGHWRESPEAPEHKYAFNERCMTTECRYLYALCTRYKTGNFPKNLVTEETTHE